jgi:glycosyltransferase involved in cell wall biosynthesis
MKVVQVNANDMFGGATRAAVRQQDAAVSLGIDSKMFVLTKESKRNDIISYDYRLPLINKIARKWRQQRVKVAIQKFDNTKPDGYETFSDDRVHLNSEVARQIPECDVINLHWISGFVDFSNIFSDMLQKAAVVWTLHDMNAFTGGCHYDYGCGRFAGKCGACPQLGSRNINDLSKRVLMRKRRAFRHRLRNHSFCVVSPSQWLAGQIQKSTLFGDSRIEVIPYGIDTDVYRPLGRSESRSDYGLSASDQVVLFLASGAASRRKGFQYLDEAMSNLDSKENKIVVSVGGEPPRTSGIYRHLHVGSVFNDAELVNVYNLADVFIIPSIEDNLPLACQEALACGVPVIGFRVGGIADMVIEGETGFLVPAGGVAELKHAIERFFSAPSLAKVLAQGARERVLRHYSYQRNASAYLKLYEELI